MVNCHLRFKKVAQNLDFSHGPWGLTAPSGVNSPSLGVYVGVLGIPPALDLER